jgi:hypothetical protein
LLNKEGLELRSIVLRRNRKNCSTFAIDPQRYPASATVNPNLKVRYFVHTQSPGLHNKRFCGTSIVLSPEKKRGCASATYVTTGEHARKLTGCTTSEQKSLTYELQS